MSVDTTHISQSFLMDGHTANFSFTFACLQSEPTSVKVRKLNSVNSNTYSTLAYTTDYTVTVNAEGAGGVVTVVDTAGTDTLFVYRQTADKQETNYTDYNQFPADTLERDFDRRTMRSQEDNDGVSRAVKFDASSSISGITLPVPSDRKTLVWSGSTGILVNSVFDPDSSSTICTSAQSLAMSAATGASIYQLQTLAYVGMATTQSNIATTQATIATTQATIAASHATTALIASSLSSIHYVTTASYINAAYITSATITGLDVTTANITGLTVGTVNITNMDTVTVGSMTVMTDATIQMAVIENATIATLRITTAATANMMDMAVATAGMLLVTTSATIANALITALTVTTVNISAGTIAKEVNIGIATTGATPTFTTQADFNKLFGSAGRASGGEIISAGTATISVASGAGFIKATDSDVATLIAFDWPSASSIAVDTNTTTYVYVSFNGGVPTIATTTADGSWDLDTSFPLGSVVQEAGECHVLFNPWWVTDGMTNLVERSDARANVFRDVNVGGLILSTTADRRVAVTAGKLWARLNEFTVSALATNSTFEVYWRTSSTIWAVADVTTLSTINYNNITTNTLTAINNNKYVNWWAYAEADDNEISFVYPQAEYNSSAEAEAVGSPSVVPNHLSKHAILIGRVIMQQGQTAPVETQSAFSSVFNASAASDHGNLSGLSDDDHTQYLLTSGTRSQGTLNVATSATIALLSSTTATITNLTAGTMTVTGIHSGLSATIGTLLVNTSGTIGLLTAGNIFCNTNSNFSLMTVGTFRVSTSASMRFCTAGSISCATFATFNLLTTGNLSVKTMATIAMLNATNATAGTFTMTGTANEANVTIGTLNVTTNATIAALNVSGNSLLNTAAITTATITSLTGTSISGSIVGTITGNVTAGNLSVSTSATIASAVITTATITSLTATTITVGGNPLLPNIQKSVAIENPTTADSITLFKVPSACTIQAMYAVVEGTLSTASWCVFHGVSRASGSAVNTAGTTTNDLTSGSTVTAFTDATIVANSWVWANILSVSGTIDTLNITIDYKVDA